MKKFLCIGALSLVSLGFSQQKSTGLITLNSQMSANIALNNTSSTVTLTFVGPNDRWFALQFGSFANGGGMQAGTDVVYWNNTTLVDGKQNGIGITPSIDTVNNWTMVSNTNNSPSTGLRTLVFTRPFNTNDANDYTFNFSNTSIDLAWSRASAAGYSLSYHGANRGYSIDTPLTTLGVEEFSLRSTVIFPNPSKGIFTLISKVPLTSVGIYSQAGSFIKRVETNDFTNSLDVSELSQGLYLLELSNGLDTYWKKIIVE